jgi:hypothetical protein
MQYEHKDIERSGARSGGSADLPGGERHVEAEVLRARHVPVPQRCRLHVGHPLGYIASDIVARFKRHNGFNVLHPMGYDSFGLPAEQYAIQTGQHPAKTTEVNIARYREQLDNIGLQLRLEPRGAHQRSRLLQVDAVDLHPTLRELVRPRSAEGQTDRRTGGSLREAWLERSMPAPSPAMWRMDLTPSPRRTIGIRSMSAQATDPAALPTGLPQRGLGELVPRTGHRARQR